MSKNTVSGTKEWAATNENVMIGCSHGCLYCYACSNAVRFNRRSMDDWTREEVNEKARAKSFGRRKGTIMFPTAHDLTPDNMDITIPFLKRMLEVGNKVLVVSKPHPMVIQEIINQLDVFEVQDNILFRFTIGSNDDETLMFWEPFAPNYVKRFASLALANCFGYQTSVSMEPLLETSEENIVALVNNLTPFVSDAIWIGKMNKVEERLKRNGHWKKNGVRKMAEELMASQTDERILSLYERLKNHPKVKWKESIKKVVGIEVPTEAGLDI